MVHLSSLMAGCILRPGPDEQAAHDICDSFVVAKSYQEADSKRCVLVGISKAGKAGSSVSPLVWICAVGVRRRQGRLVPGPEAGHADQHQPRRRAARAYCAHALAGTFRHGPSRCASRPQPCQGNSSETQQTVASRSCRYDPVANAHRCAPNYNKESS